MTVHFDNKGRIIVEAEFSMTCRSNKSQPGSSVWLAYPQNLAMLGCVCVWGGGGGSGGGGRGAKGNPR